MFVCSGFFCFFFLSGFSFTDTDNSQDSRGMEGTIFYSTLPLPPAHEHWGIYLQLCMWDDYHVFLIATLVYQTATRWDLPPYRITIWPIDWWCNVCFLTWWIDSRFLLQRFAMENRWIWNRIDYHPCITSGPTKPFPNSPPFPNTISEAVRGYILLTVQCLCDLRDAMPRHCSSSASHPTLA